MSHAFAYIFLEILFGKKPMNRSRGSTIWAKLVKQRSDVDNSCVK